MKRFLPKSRDDAGFVLVSVYFLLAALLALLGAYYSITNLELASTKFQKDSVSGFYAAEAGLNTRAEEIRDIFVGYNRPSGTSPLEAQACQDTNLGSGNFACQALAMNGRNVSTYVEEDPSNPVILTIPPGEKYQNLNAQEYRYTVRSRALNKENKTEAQLELRFKSRLVPLFQFVAFYNKDLEILPGPAMNLNGPVHTNGDLYLNSGASLAINGQVTSANSLYRGRKNDSTCLSNPVSVTDPLNPLNLLLSCPARTLIPESTLPPWNGMIQENVSAVTVPEPDALDAAPGNIYFDRADLRLKLRLNGAENPIIDANSPTGVYVIDNLNNVLGPETQRLHACAGTIGGRVIGYTNTFRNNRENKMVKMLEVNLRELFSCLHTSNWLTGVGGSKLLSDDTDGGLVLHFSVAGPSSALAANQYGVRIRNASTLRSTNAGHPLVKGLTIVTDQAIYTHGHYNSVNKIPAAIMADSLNVLSVAWNLNDAASNNPNTAVRQADHTTINSAFLSGTDTTGNNEGAGGQGGAYNGGLENYPRFHERWTGRTLTYRGSFVSLNRPRHVNGIWIYGNPQYEAPNRNWDYDTAFNDAANLPPLTPRFVYLRQELFVRDFEQ